MKKCPVTGKPKMDKLEAQIALSRVIMKNKKHRRQRDQNRPKRFYRCEFCHWYHLTSQDKRSVESRD